MSKRRVFAIDDTVVAVVTSRWSATNDNVDLHLFEIGVKGEEVYQKCRTHRPFTRWAEDVICETLTEKMKKESSARIRRETINWLNLWCHNYCANMHRLGGCVCMCVCIIYMACIETVCVYYIYGMYRDCVCVLYTCQSLYTKYYRT